MNRITVEKPNEGSKDIRLSVDGILVDGVRIYGISGLSAHFNEELAIDAIRSVSVNDLFECFESFDIMLNYWGGLESWAIGELSFESRDVLRRGSRSNCQLQVTFDAEHWRCVYSIADLADELKLILTESSSPLLYWPSDDNEDSILNGFGIHTSIEPTKNVGQILEELTPQLQISLEYAEKRLLESRKGAIVQFFDFPEPYRPACEQYLIYFGQFLSDLGIAATTELREEGTRVLFTVTPVDKKDALDTIREALNAYLQIPASSEAANEMAKGSDIAFLQLSANVSHLKGHLILAKAIIQAKDAAISGQITEINNLREQIDLRSYSPHPASAVDLEPVIEGVLSVKPLEIRGAVIDLPNILRRLKRRLSN
jgi:hypothetical protein